MRGNGVDCGFLGSGVGFATGFEPEDAEVVGFGFIFPGVGCAAFPLLIGTSPDF